MFSLKKNMGRSIRKNILQDEYGNRLKNNTPNLEKKKRKQNKTKRKQHVGETSTKTTTTSFRSKYDDHALD